jgi:glycosyltransferase involved in cell wall biosynthesis
MKLAIFIPAFNEERSIGSVVLQAKRYGQVFVVDDGSTDRTSAIARAAGAKVVRRSQNGGYGAALKTAFLHARKTDADAFVFLDADGQHDPAEIPLVAAPVLEGRADLSIGSRFLGKATGAPAYRLIGVGVINRLSAIQAQKKGVDYQCGFRAFSRSAAGKIKVRQDGYQACGEVVVSAQRKGLRIAEVPVHIRYFEEGGNPLAHGAGLVSHIMAGIAKRKPMVFFGGGGMLLLAVSALLGIFVVNTFYSKGVLPIGTAFLTVFAGISGLVLILIGINLYTLGAVLGRRWE